MLFSRGIAGDGEDEIGVSRCGVTDGDGRVAFAMT